MNTAQKPVLSITEAAAKLRWSKNRMYAAAHRGALPGLRVVENMRWFVVAAELEAAIAGGVWSGAVPRP